MRIITSVSNFSGTEYHVLDVLNFHFNKRTGYLYVVGGIPTTLKPSLIKFTSERHIELIEWDYSDLSILDNTYDEFSVIMFGNDLKLLKKCLSLKLHCYVIKEDDL